MILRDRPSHGARLPTYVVAAGIVVLIGALAALQYRWLGQISDAERERLKASLATQAGEFAQDVDREVTRAYLLFQVDTSVTDAGSALAERYDRWNATARFPKLIKEIYLVRDADAPQIERLDPRSRTLAKVDWPRSLDTMRRDAVANVEKDVPLAGKTVVVHTVTAPILESIPAIVVPTPVFVMSTDQARPVKLPDRLPPSAVCLVLDREYIARDLFPALSEQHFRAGGLDYRVAVLHGNGEPVYTSDPSFRPSRQATADASADFLQVRAQDFGALASEVRRFTAFTMTRGADADRLRDTVTTATTTATIAQRLGPNVSIVLQQGTTKSAPAGSLPILRAAATASHGWKLVVEHPSGSLEHSISTARRRNLAISMGILGVLGMSLAFLVVSTRRAQALARQQLDFVATVSHELRTPLAVIRSAADNLADGVVEDGARTRQYGELVRTEGRRLTELVEQILTFAGLQSGQLAIASAPVAIDDLLREVADTCRATATPAGVSIELQVPEGLPRVRGDEAALRRVFQNLVGNAVKYGAGGKWVGVEARAADGHVNVTVADRGIGIASADHARIFDPFYRASGVVQAQIQGAGIGLSLVSRIVAAHGGHVSLKSAPGEGAAFTVSLPAAQEQ